MNYVSECRSNSSGLWEGCVLGRSRHENGTYEFHKTLRIYWQPEWVITYSPVVTLFYGFASPILNPALSALRLDPLWRTRHTFSGSVLRHTTFRDVGACRASDLHAWSEREREREREREKSSHLSSNRTDNKLCFLTAAEWFKGLKYVGHVSRKYVGHVSRKI
jgi:hypothetical protein